MTIRLTGGGHKATRERSDHHSGAEHGVHLLPESSHTPLCTLRCVPPDCTAALSTCPRHPSVQHACQGGNESDARGQQQGGLCHSPARARVCHAALSAPGCPAPHVMPQDFLPYEEFSVRLPMSDVPRLVEILRSYTDEDVVRLRLGMAKHYRWGHRAGSLWTARVECQANTLAEEGWG